MNVLVLMCDQLRYDALGCHGNPCVHTPNIDRLAAHSVRFTRASCSSPVCGPTRHSLATGLYPYQHGVINNVVLPLEGMHTIAHHLRRHEFRTACFGHMHWQRIETNDGREHAFPDHGYEHYDAIVHDTSSLTGSQKSRRAWESIGSTMQATAGPSVVNEEDSYSKQVADASIARLCEWAKKGESFLSWTSFNDPHPPFFPPAELYAKYAAMDLPPPVNRPPDARPSHEETSDRVAWSMMTELDHRVMKSGYYGLVELADRQLGRVLDVLDELDLSQNTIIIFTADHGEMMGDFGRYMKSVMWEQSVHIPFFLCHPDIEPGQRDELVEHVDLFPTVCELLDLPVPDQVQGRSLAPLLESTETPSDWRQYALSQLEDDLMVRTDRWKLIYRNGEPRHLFDLESDPDEFYDCLAEQHDVAAELESVWQADHPDLFAANERIRASGRVRKKKRKPAITFAETP